MIEGLKTNLLTIFLLVVTSPAFCQSFEGCITLHAKTDQADTRSVLSVKGKKTLLEVEKDSAESIKILKDWDAQTTTMLRRKNNMKYGYRLNSIMNTSPDIQDTTKNKDTGVETFITNETKLIGNMRCTKVLLKSSYAVAEAWVTKEPGFSLSKYFPEFLGEDSRPYLYELRKAADKEGFILSYWDKLQSTGKEYSLELTIEQKEIPHDLVSISADYTVLDEAGIKNLYQESQHSEQAKKQMEEFMQLFGNK